MRSEVQIFPGPPTFIHAAEAGLLIGAIAQLGERLLCKQEVVGSIPSGSTRRSVAAANTANKSPQNSFVEKIDPRDLDIWPVERRVSNRA